MGCHAILGTRLFQYGHNVVAEGFDCFWTNAKQAVVGCIKINRKTVPVIVRKSNDTLRVPGGSEKLLARTRDPPGALSSENALYPNKFVELALS